MNDLLSRAPAPKPAPAAPADTAPGADDDGPRDRTEEMLCEIWASVLGVERIGIHDRFFRLGGDSIRSVRVMAQAKECGIDISLQQIFQHQTIAEIKTAVTSQGPQGAGEKEQSYQGQHQ